MNGIQSDNLNQLIQALKQHQLMDQETMFMITTAIVNGQDNTLNLIDSILLPYSEFNNESVKLIESVITTQDNNSIALGLSIYGKMNTFYQYINPSIFNSLISKFVANLKSMNDKQLASAAIGLALAQLKDGNIWNQIIAQTLEIGVEFHSLMRIATSISIVNQGTKQFWESFLDTFLSQLEQVNEDVYTQSILSLSQQHLIQLNETHQNQLEQYLVNHDINIENKTSLYASFARMRIGSPQFYSNLCKDIYCIKMHGDDLGHFLIQILQVKERIPKLSLNVLVARAYSEQMDQKMIDEISVLIK